MKKGKLVVISGPSGVGKGTIINELIKKYNYFLSTSMTTRKKRPNEVDKKDYYFVSTEEFKENITKNNFLEYAEVYKNTFYGTPKDKVLKQLKKDENVILEINVEGALQVKKNYPEAILIFIEPPSFRELKKRLKNRKTETKETIKERLKTAKQELKQRKKYDYVIKNIKVCCTVEEINEIILK